MCSQGSHNDQSIINKCLWKLNNYGVGTPVFLGALTASATLSQN